MSTNTLIVIKDTPDGFVDQKELEENQRRLEEENKYKVIPISGYVIAKPQRCGLGIWRGLLPKQNLIGSVFELQQLHIFPTEELALAKLKEIKEVGCEEQC